MRAPAAFALGAAAAVAGIALAAIAVAASGRLGVSALEDHSGPVERLLVTARERAVAAGARGVAVPPLDDPALAARGAALYRQHCAACHGGRRTPPAPFALGLNPVPPELGGLGTAAGEEPAEAYWVIANGLRMTGMPGFEIALTDEEIWALVAHLRSVSSPAARTPAPRPGAAPGR